MAEEEHQADQQRQQELIMKLGAYEQQMRKIQEQLQVIEEHLVHLSKLNFGLDDLKGQEGSEILAPLGQGIFVRAKLISEELLVDVGKQHFVPKTIQEGKDVIAEQLQKLEGVKEQLNGSLNQINEEVGTMLTEAQAQGA